MCKYLAHCTLSRDITLPTKVRLVKAMVFPVVMYECEFDRKEGWMSKNWCFQTVVLEKTLESPLDCKEIKPVNPKRSQPWIFTGRTDTEAEAPILGQLTWRADSLEKTLILGKMEDRRRRKWQRTRWLDGITTQQIWVWANSRRQRRMGKPGVLQSRGLQRVGHDWATELSM